MKKQKTKIIKEKSDTIDIWVCTNDHSKVRRFYANEAAADRHAESINDDLLSPVRITVNCLRIDLSTDIKKTLINFLNQHAFIGVQ